MPYAFLPDSSVLMNGKILDFIQDGTLENYQPTERVQPLEGDQIEIVLSRVVLAEIENQANRTKSCGSITISIIEDLYKLGKQNKIKISVVGRRPTLEQIRLNAGGELDAQIRHDAQESKAIIVTSDHIQATMGLIEGIEVFYIQSLPQPDILKGDKKVQKIQDFFDDTTMSIHLRAHCVPLAKRGKPGEWNLVPIEEKVIDPTELGEIAARIVSEAKSDEHSFIERDEPGVTVIQIRNYRIVICRPPFSNAIEITAVRPLVSLTLDDYDLEPKIYRRLDVAEGILVAGSPGAGKSTFISALVKYYLGKKKIIKTLESVRDLVVPPEVSQYAPLEGDLEKTADVLLLVRPDFTIFDEVRVDRDFKIFGDMRLAGVGMVGVVHASHAVDAIQRFIRRVELGVIPSIVDTVIFIEKGNVGEILTLNMTVKKPTGFKDEDLSRPVIEVRDFLNNDLLYEIYNFGQDTVVSRVSSARNRSLTRPMNNRKRQRKARTFQRQDFFQDQDDEDDEDSDNSEDLNVAPKSSGPNRIPIRVHQTKKGFQLEMGRDYGNAYINIYANDELIFSATLNKEGEVKIKRTSPVFNRLSRSIEKNEDIYASFE